MSVSNFSEHFPLFASLQTQLDCRGCIENYHYTMLAVTTVTATGLALLAATEIIPFAVVIGATAVLGSATAAAFACKFFCQNIRLNIPNISSAGNVSRGINLEHLREFSGIEDRLPQVPATVQIGNLLELFDNINFADQNAPDYVDPDQIQNDSWNGNGIDQNAARENLRTWVEMRIPQQQNYMGVPSDAAGKRQWYENLTDLLRHTIFAFQRLETDLIYHTDDSGQKHYIPLDAIADEDVPRREEQIRALNAANRIILNLAAGMDHCGGRVQTEAMIAYQKAVLGIQGDAFELRIKILLHDMRMGIVQEVAFTNHRNVDDAYRAHVVVAYLQHLCGPRGILGQRQIQYHDHFIRAAWGITRDRALRTFDEKYTSQRIIECVKTAIDGIPSETGGRFSELDNGEVRQWFREHPPAEWRNRPVNQELYSNAGEQYVYEGVFDRDNHGNYLIKQTAVEHLLRSLRVIE